MPSTKLTPTAKETLRKAIRRLRDSLIRDIDEEARGEYQLGAKREKAKLSEAKARRRERLEDWIEEQCRAAAGQKKKGKGKADQELRDRFLGQAVEQAAHTLLNRLVILRLLEHAGLSKPAVVTGGTKSEGYRELREFAPALTSDTSDDTRGYKALLDLVFDELSLELPGVFGNVGLTQLFPVPASALNDVIEVLNDPALDSAWEDDTTLGWVYQFWNDPKREALDAKINSGGKIEPHEIASKTQMFTERYMVEWLLQNSLGQTWLAMCDKHGWTPDFEQVREALESRRAEWRAKREAGEVAPDALMPIHSELEDRWKYWVPQPMPDDAPATAPESVRDLKLLDPACGSGHFLVIAFDLLAALYAEEARHRGESWSPEDVAAWIVERNLHGIDIDSRAIQIAAAAVWLKAKTFAPVARIRRMNLVAPVFRLGALPKDDPALSRLESELQREVGISPELTRELVGALAGVDHLGTLLRVDQSIAQALAKYAEKTRGAPAQGNLFTGMPPQQLRLGLDEAKITVLDKLGVFLDAHQNEGDLGLRLEGEQLAAGVRFVQIAREGAYDIVVGNPPYQGTSKMAEGAWIKKHYPRGKADLYTCFLERGLELANTGGVSALLTMRGWMFLSQFTAVRESLLEQYDLRSLGDFDRGAFDDVPNEVLAVAGSVLRRGTQNGTKSVAAQPTPIDDASYDRQRTGRKRAAVLAQVGRFDFDVAKLSGIEGTPLVYWWDNEFLQRYVNAEKLGRIAPAKAGAVSGNHLRFLRLGWELRPTHCANLAPNDPLALKQIGWIRYVKGARGMCWFDPCDEVCNWRRHGLEIKANAEQIYGSYTRQIRNEHLYFKPGIAVAGIGSSFSARAYRWRAVFDNMAASVFPPDRALALCSMNTTAAREIIQSLNPGLHFEISDVNRLPLIPLVDTAPMFDLVERAFGEHESHREPSVEFKQPGPSPWRYAQDWAQRAVDRPKGDPLPPYEPEYDPPDPTAFVSFAIGVALGRFGANGEGILYPASLDASPTNGAAADSEDVLPAGILFVSAAPSIPSSLAHPAAKRIEDAWNEHGPAITGGKPMDLDDWLRKDFFAYHRSLYENRPIYFPLSSAKKNFVAFVSIHRWTDNTLQTLLARHLHPARKQLEGEITDLNTARASSDKKTQAAAEKQYAKTQVLYEELEAFIRDVTQCAEKGAPPTDAKCAPREVDAPFRMDLDDGVMINSAALWPLLAPQWKAPAKWWKELCNAQGRKDYDWAHLAARYFPTRVDEKCKSDPSLAVAHGCFWKYHPAKAYAWELRLQDEIAPDFTIDETGSDDSRNAFLKEHAGEATEIREKEDKRRERNRKKAASSEADDEPDAPPESDQGSLALEG